MCCPVESLVEVMGGGVGNVGGAGSPGDPSPLAPWCKITITITIIHIPLPSFNFNLKTLVEVNLFVVWFPFGITQSFLKF